MAVDARSVDENCNVAMLHPTHFHVPVARTNQCAACEQEIARLCFLYFDGGRLVEALREHLGEAFRHVLNDEKATGKILWKLRKKILEGVGTTGRNANSHDTRRPMRHRRTARFLPSR